MQLQQWITTLNRNEYSQHIFWDNIHNYTNQVKVYMGTLNIKKHSQNSQNHDLIITQLINDIKLKCNIDKLVLKLFHDVDFGINIVHYLVIVSTDQLDAFQQTLIWMMSNTQAIDKIENHKNQINHYLGYDDHHGYESIKKYSVISPRKLANTLHLAEQTVS